VTFTQDVAGAGDVADDVTVITAVITADVTAGVLSSPPTRRR
jgi:hypothetical protein